MRFKMVHRLHERLFEVNVVDFRDDDDRPQTMRQLRLGFFPAVGDLALTGYCFDEFYQVVDVACKSLYKIYAG